MDRVFLDANVLFSAAYRSDSGVLRLWEVAGAVVVTSDYAIEEATRNLPTRTQRGALAALAARCEVVRGTFDGVPLPRRVRLPADDEPILRAAIAARCTHLLTGNLRDFGPYLGTRVAGVLIQRPAAYLAASGQAPGVPSTFRHGTARAVRASAPRRSGILRRPAARGFSE